LPGTTQCGHEELTQVLHAAAADSSASEAHGLLSGTLCAGGKTGPALWLEHLLGEGNTLSAAAADCSDMLLTLQSDILRQFNDDVLGFELLLPVDDAPLSLRTEALSQWCAGFLFGLALGGFREDVAMPGNASEVMKDFSEISRAGFTCDAGEEADEAAYMEIVEYVRMGALLLHEELQPVPTARLQ
jgi:hypothetical protein